jgi:acetyltransferase-like isoleucine patch superfamily enzyme
MNYFIHQTAEVAKNAKIGKNTKIWHYSQIREHVRIGKNCIIGKNVYIDSKVKIGDNCKIQNNCSIYHGTVIDDGVIIGPHVVCTNDKIPRAINRNGKLKTESDWKVGKIHVEYGASIGANSTILPNVTIGKFALIGAGSVITKNVPDFALVYGNPAQVRGQVNKEGKIIKRI